MKKLIKIIILVVLVMVSGCAIQKKEENAKVIDTSMFLYKVSNQEGEYSYFYPPQYIFVMLSPFFFKKQKKTKYFYLII